MEALICNCGWDIPGVDWLPGHSHYYTNELVPSGRVHDRGPFKGQPIMSLVPDPYRAHFYVDWKALARG